MCIFLALWFFVSFFHLIDPFFFPNPIIFAKELIVEFGRGSIFTDMYATVIRIAIAFAIASAAGVPLGLLLGLYKNMYRSVEFFVDMMRSTAPMALFPLFLIVFGIGDTSKIMTAALTSVFVIIFHVAHGVLHMKNSRKLASEMMGADRLTVFKNVIVWEALPSIFVGLRVGLSWVMVIIIATEMFVGTSVGLGHRIIDAQITYNIPAVYVAIFVTAFIGYLVNLFSTRIEKKMLHWVKK